MKGLIDTVQYVLYNVTLYFTIQLLFQLLLSQSGKNVASSSIAKRVTDITSSCHINCCSENALGLNGAQLLI